jgi:hypothetical protein
VFCWLNRLVARGYWVMFEENLLLWMEIETERNAGRKEYANIDLSSHRNVL